MKTHQPRKRFGQHFLRSPVVLQQIIQATNPRNTEHFVEIGCGEGVLTELLLPHCARLDGIEIDNDLIYPLTARFAKSTSFFLHHQDVLQMDFHHLSSTPNSLRIIGNLPYNIASPLLFKLFRELDIIRDIHVMLQKEVAERITAAVGSKNYNRLSVMTQYFCDNTLLFDVERTAFFPPPQVNSSVIRMQPRTITQTASNIETFSNLVKIAFAHRRKNLRNCLKEVISPQTLEQLGINPNQRPQELTVSDFVTISNALQ